jgi:hypothetical protein
MGSPPRRPAIPASRKRRVFYAISGIATVILVGAVGFHVIEGMGWVDSFYFESMLATGQGPPVALTTDVGKIFASVMAFVSFGSVITGLFVTLVPIVSELWREGMVRLEEDARTLEKEFTRKKEKAEEQS